MSEDYSDYKTKFDRLVDGDPDNPGSMPEYSFITGTRVDGSERTEKEREQLESDAREKLFSVYEGAPEPKPQPRPHGMSEAEYQRYQAGDLRKEDGWHRLSDLRAHIPGKAAENGAQEADYARMWQRGAELHDATEGKRIVAAEETDGDSVRDASSASAHRMQEFIDAQLLAGAVTAEEPKLPWRKRAWHRVKRIFSRRES